MTKNPEAFLGMTAIAVPEFFKLRDRVKDEFGRQHYQKHQRHDAVRKYGAGRTHTLPFDDRLCAYLMITKGVLKYAVAQIFDVSTDTVMRAYNEMEPVIVKALKSPEKIFWHVTHRRKDDDIRKWINPDKASLDGVVINTTKPGDKDTILEYSRRGKGTGLNVLTVVDGDGQLAWISDAEPASYHDTKVYDMHHNVEFLATFNVVLSDRGLGGAEKDMRVSHVYGIKRRPGCELAEEDRKINS